MTQVHSFPPVSSPGATRLILGSMPGKASLAANRYYAHPRNLFWHVMETVLELPAGLSYERRCQTLIENGIALWDVLKTCTRSGSLDSDIVTASIVPNDLPDFLNSHPDIGTVFFNGAKAHELFLRHVAPDLGSRGEALTLHRLPSTSPANASIPYQTKVAAWRRGLLA